jgi:lipopolysaccharide biosynthesis regulator YciM
MEQRKQIDPEIARSLVQTALLAIWERQYDRANDILHGLSSFKSDWLPLAYAYTLLYQALGQTERAVEVLQRALREQPDNDMVKSLLGYVLQQDARSGWRELLHEVITNDADANAVELAQHLLQSDGRGVAHRDHSATVAPIGAIRA